MDSPRAGQPPDSASALPTRPDTAEPTDSRPATSNAGTGTANGPASVAPQPSPAHEPQEGKPQDAAAPGAAPPSSVLLPASTAGAGPPVRGPLRYQVTTSSPQLEAGRAFSVYVKITNPYPVPVKIQQINSRLPVEFQVADELPPPSGVLGLKIGFPLPFNPTISLVRNVTSSSPGSNPGGTTAVTLQPGIRRCKSSPCARPTPCSLRPLRSIWTFWSTTRLTASPTRMLSTISSACGHRCGRSSRGRLSAPSWATL